MNHIPIDLAVEDALTEAVLRRIVASCGNRYAVGSVYRRGGNGYLRKTIQGWNRAAKGKPFLLVTDLDAVACPSLLIQEWLGETPKHQNLLFRVAVREIDAWLLADRDGLSRHLAVKTALVPTSPEDLPDPKCTLIELARASKRRQVRDDLVPRKGSTAKQGPGYNPNLCDFVSATWSVEAAAANAKSLERTLKRLEEFTPVW